MRILNTTVIKSAREKLLLNVHGGEYTYKGRGRVGKRGEKSETSKQGPTR